MYKLLPSPVFKPASSSTSLPSVLLKIAAVTTAFLVAPPTLATEYECRSNQETRLIRVDYPGFDHLCEVSVTKEDQSREVKWYADSNSSFCSVKIVDLVEKYQDLWGFSCEEWPDYDGIEELSVRQRKFLDDLVRSSRTTNNDNAQYTLLGTRALVGPLTNDDAENSADLLAVQLFMGRVPSGSNSNPDQTSGDGAESPALAAALVAPAMANRILLIEDNGQSYNTLATQDNLNELIEIDRAGYSLDSAMIDQIHPNGEVEVTTLVSAPGDDSSALPSCYGSQRFTSADEGLLAISEHEFVCSN